MPSREGGEGRGEDDDDDGLRGKREREKEREREREESVPGASLMGAGISSVCSLDKRVQARHAMGAPLPWRTIEFWHQDRNFFISRNPDNRMRGFSRLANVVEPEESRICFSGSNQVLDTRIKIGETLTPILSFFLLLLEEAVGGGRRRGGKPWIIVEVCARALL